MLSPEEYCLDPCGTLSIPLWKAKTISIPACMRIVHSRDFDPAMAAGFHDTVYFRLYHDLREIQPTPLSGYTFLTATPEDMDTIVSIINRSYDNLRVSREQLLHYTKTPVYAPDLWVLLLHEETGEAVGCGLGDFDDEVGELILEWIQVLPSCRRAGLGRAIVTELLCRKPASARFATVSGKARSPSCPEKLYRACGFTGCDCWHILTPKEV